MGKRTFSISLALALVAGVFSAIPATAQTPPAIPAVVNIEDPSGDANGINDQGFGGVIGHQGDNPGGAGIGAADILKVWFTHDAAKLNTHIHTTFPPPNKTPGFGLLYRVAFDGIEGCSRVEAYVPSNTFQGEVEVSFVCAEKIAGELKIDALEDGTGITTLTFDRAAVAGLTDGAVLAAPAAHVRGAEGTNGAALLVPVFDNTLPGTDYTISGGGGPVVEPAPEEEPPGKDDPPGKGKKKGCKKGKGKKKGACPGKKPGEPKPPVDSCPEFVPGEEGAEAETTIVTAAATEEKPVEVTIAAPLGVPEVEVGHVFQNMQVDAAGAEAGLYVRYEFPVQEDHDIYLNYADGTEAAHAAGFNPAPVPVALGCCDGTGSGGHSEQGAEVLDGIRTADCGGYTLDMASFMSEGGDMTLKLWLGEIQNDPAAPGSAQDAMQMFYSLMGL